MRPAIALAAAMFLLTACGDDTEAPLAKCKADMLKIFDDKLEAERAKPDAKPFAIDFVAGIGRIVFEGSLSRMVGPEGLTKCREMLAKNRAGNGT